MNLNEIVQLPLKRYSLEIEGQRVEFFAEPNSEASTLLEAQYRGKPIGGTYSADFHAAHTTPGYDHLHVYCKNNMLFAMNINGTAHDQSHGVQIPNRVADGIRKHFPNFTLPPGNFIEAASPEILARGRQILLG